MITFTFIAYNGEGLKVCGAKSCASEESLKEYLDKNGLSNYKYFKSKTKYKKDNFKNISSKELSIFCRQMSVIFFSQITLMEGVLLLSEQSENEQLKIALCEIYEHMSYGYTFAESIGMYDNIFGKYLINMIFVGETSGTLDNIFSIMSNYFEKEDIMRRKIKSAVMYPAILAVLMGVIILFLILKILPMFQETLYKMGHDIPNITKVILNASNFINNYLIYFVIVAAAIILAFSYYIKTEKGRIRFDKLKVTVPISKYIYARIITARFSRCLSILLKSGVQLLNALDETRSLIDNVYIDEKFSKSVAKIKAGNDLSDSLSDMKLFPPLFLKIVMIGQATGHLDDMLDKSAAVFDSEVDESLERFRVMIEPILIIILSVIVGIILVSVMIPMISIMNNIG